MTFPECYPDVTKNVFTYLAETWGLLGRWALGLLRERVGELGDALIGRV